mmetsp:Transcript_73483/g.195301  ORF Transcript_73483/g.195301 Transcript_73483/m.195301 type:complete len:227 (-) Transcript_73483:1135-1815(-)
MAAAVDDVERRNRHHKLVRGLAGQLRNVLVQGHLTCSSPRSADRHGDGKDSIGAELCLRPTPLVLRAVKLLNHDFVNLGLLGNIHANQLWRDELVHILHRSEHALAQQAVLVIVTQLQRLVDARGGAAGHGRAEERRLGAQVDLHRWIPAGIEDLAGHDTGDLRAAAPAASLRRRVVQRRDTRQLLAFQELQGSAAARAAVGHLVLGVILLASGGSVAAADDSDCA